MLAPRIAFCILFRSRWRRFRNIIVLYVRGNGAEPRDAEPRFDGDGRSAYYATRQIGDELRRVSLIFRVRATETDN